MMRRLRFGMLALGALVLSSTGSLAAAIPPVYVETPELVPLVETGKLPPVAERLPAVPRVIDLPALGRRNGRHGGTMRMLMAREKDLRVIVYYSYARLVGYNAKLQLVPDILESFDVVDGRQFTLKLRKGHKWSDGHPFTVEDFRFYWEHVANNKDLSPAGPHPHLLVNGKPPKFEVLDPETVRYTWDAPNPYFLPALAGTRALYIFEPAHYMKQFHKAFTGPATLAAAVAAKGVRDWAALYWKMSGQAIPDNPDLPTLEAWHNTTSPPSSIYRLERNPYFHRVDSAGRQLPYADAIRVSIGSASLIPAKTGSGDSDLQGRYIGFDDYTFLKAAEKRHVVKVRLWDQGLGSVLALYPNLNTNDLVWRKVLRDVRVRRALSLGINRREINEVIYFGLGRPSANTVLPASPLYRQSYADAYARFDLKEANRLLDAAGLDKRDAYGFRLLPDGRRADIIVETSGENSEQSDVLGLIHDTWSELGLRLFVRPTQRDLFRKRVYAGDTIMSVWAGYDNAVPTADMSPMDLAPTSKIQYQWSRWGDYYWTKGKAGVAPDMPAAKELLIQLAKWRTATTGAERVAAWQRMLQIHAENVFTIGTVNGTKQPIVTAPNLQNVPDTGLFNYFPGAYFGIYMPDTFYFRTGKR